MFYFKLLRPYVTKEVMQAPLKANAAWSDLASKKKTGVVRLSRNKRMIRPSGYTKETHRHNALL
jgi:hypothetical protein